MGLQNNLFNTKISVRPLLSLSPTASWVRKVEGGGQTAADFRRRRLRSKFYFCLL